MWLEWTIRHVDGVIVYVVEQSLHRAFFSSLRFVLAPLQPLTINGRDQRARFIPNGPPQPLLTEQNEDEVKIDQDEKEKLKNDLVQLKNELEKSKETIARLQKSEEQMRERYSFAQDGISVAWT